MHTTRHFLNTPTEGRTGARSATGHHLHRDTASLARVLSYIARHQGHFLFSASPNTLEDPRGTCIASVTPVIRYVVRAERLVFRVAHASGGAAWRFCRIHPGFCVGICCHPRGLDMGNRPFIICIRLPSHPVPQLVIGPSEACGGEGGARHETQGDQGEHTSGRVLV